MGDEIYFIKDFSYEIITNKFISNENILGNLHSL